MSNETDLDAKISLDAGEQEGAVPTTVYVDDIYLTEVSGERNEEDIDISVSMANLLQNGVFEDTEDFK